MKKIFKLIVSIMLTISVVGCATSTKEQEKVVTSYFEALKSFDIDTLNELTVDDTTNEMVPFTKDDINDLEKEMGKEFSEEMLIFIKDAMNEMVVSYNINEINNEKNKCIITVDVTLKNTLSIIENSEKIANEYSIKYMQEHPELLADFVNDDEEAIKKILSEVSQNIFDDLRKQFENAEVKKGSMIFELIEKDNKWLISNVSSKS